MILATTIASSASILIAGQSFGDTGWTDGNYGNLLRQPIGARENDTEITRLYHTTSFGELRLTLDGDQTTAMAGYTLYVDGNSYAFSAASTFQFVAGTRTEVNWSEGTSPFTDGEAAIIRLEA